MKIKKILLTILSGSFFIIPTFFITKIKIGNKQNRKIDKFKDYYYLLNQWLELKQSGKNFERYFAKNNINRIVIYGMGELGKRLADELKDTNVIIEYAIDKNSDSMYAGIDIYEHEIDVNEVDAIVVTAIFAFDEIEKQLAKTFKGTIISLQEVIDESY